MEDIAKLKRQRLLGVIAAAAVIAAGLAALRLLAPGDPASPAFYVTAWAVAQAIATFAVFLAYARVITSAERLRDVESLTSLRDPLPGIGAVTARFGEIVRSRTGLRLVACVIDGDEPGHENGSAEYGIEGRPITLADSTDLSTTHQRAVAGLMESHGEQGMDAGAPTVLERSDLEPLQAEALDTLNGGVFVLVPMLLGNRLHGTACFVGASIRDIAGYRGTLVAALARHVAAMVWTNGLLRRIEEVDRRVEQVDRLRTQERETAEQLDSEVGFKSGLMYNLSHEMRTSLAALKAATDLLMGEESIESDGEHFNRLLRSISRNVTRQEGLVSNILDMASIESGTLVLDPEMVDVASLVTEVSDTVAPLFEQRRQVLTAAVPKGLPKLSADRRRLSQVIVNLLANARNYSPEGSETLLNVEARGDRMVFVVSDSGPGVPTAERERVFEAFYRTPTSGESGVPGSGLGLAIAKSLVELHVGAIWVEESATAGAAFMFSLPMEGQSEGPHS